ncbi:MAG: helix-turn-helix domain-containing protein [Rariglobus sp.]
MSTAPRLSLHDWSSLRTELLWIYDHAPAAKARHVTADHRQSNWAWYLRRGEVRITTRHGPLTARAGQWLFLPNERHPQDFSDDASLISINFRCQWPAGDPLFGSSRGSVLDGTAHPRLEQTAKRLEKLVLRHFPVQHYIYAQQFADYSLFLRFQRAFFEWLEAWFDTRIAIGDIPSRNQVDARLLRSLHLLDEAPLEPGLPQTALQTVAGVSRVQLNRLFRTQLKLTPLQYWERRRLESARLFLETSDLPLKELAARLGFRSDSHFTVWFKRHAGSSPGRYREQPVQR